MAMNSPAQGSTSGDTLATTIATGTQDLAALAGLFCTDAVERNLLAVQYGYCAIAASSLSILGILGVVKSFLKLVIGLDKARNAGFNLDTVRPLLGYGEGESPPAGDLIDCNSVAVDFSHPEEVRIQVSKHRYDSVTTPALRVGSSWGSGLANKTVVNLGDPDFDRDFRQSSTAIILVCLLCPGVNVWLLMCVPYPWSWLRIVAIPVLHACLFIMTILPIAYCWQNLGSGKNASSAYWRSLNEPTPSVKKMRFLQAKVYQGDVIHFQGYLGFLSNRWIRALGFVISIVTAVCYVAQYAILKQATNKEAIIWVSCQAVLALLRVMFWAWDPEFDNIAGLRAYFVMVNNTCSEKMTAKELLCGLVCGRTASSPLAQEMAIPKWAWDYLITRPLKDILKEAFEPPRYSSFEADDQESITEGGESESQEIEGDTGHETEDDKSEEIKSQKGKTGIDTSKEVNRKPGYIPWSAEYCALLDIDFDVILSKRRSGYTLDRDRISPDDWRLCLWRDKNDPMKIHPIILVCIPLTRMTPVKGSSKLVPKTTNTWIQAVDITESPCLEFMVVADDTPAIGTRGRQHVREVGDAPCSTRCEINLYTPLRFRDDAWKFLRDRTYWVKKEIVPAINDLRHIKVNSLDADVCMSATVGWDEGRKDLRWDSLSTGIERVACYIDTGGKLEIPKSTDNA